MKIVKVDATNSTNSLAKEINRSDNFQNFCVSAEYQTSGRGQKSSKWESERSKNLTFTIVYNNLQLQIKHQFVLNALICLGIHKVLKSYHVESLFLKWPNDILADQKKICGILIENAISGSIIKTSYIGIGLNVNQQHFDNLNHASSLKNILDKDVDRDQLLKDLINELNDLPKHIHDSNPEVVLDQYKARLYKFNTKSDFLINDSLVKGLIKDVDCSGRLNVDFIDGKTGKFQHKEISQVI